MAVKARVWIVFDDLAEPFVVTEMGPRLTDDGRRRVALEAVFTAIESLGRFAPKGWPVSSGDDQGQSSEQDGILSEGQQKGSWIVGLKAPPSP